jgi:hypothetical protein
VRTIRSKLSYANVISTLCLFLLLGGGAALAAGKLGKNSVGTKQLKNGSVTAAKVKKHTLTSTNINLAKLGMVPSASNATTANTATTAATANALAAMEPTHLVGTSGQPSFQSGSSNYSEASEFGKFPPVGFFRDHDGIVHLEGLAKTGKEAPTPGVIFTLPPGFRPASGTTQIYPTEENGVVIIFGSKVSIGGMNLEGDVLVTSKDAFLSGLAFRAES